MIENILVTIWSVVVLSLYIHEKFKELTTRLDALQSPPVKRGEYKLYPYDDGD